MGSHAQTRSVLLDSRSGENLSQLAAKDFARGRAGNSFDKVDFARLLVVGEAVSHKSAKRFLHGIVGELTGTQNHKGAGDLSGLKVRARDNTTIPHRGVFHEDGFDFGGSDREALVLDHFFSTIKDVEEIIGIAVDDVAGPVPPVPQNTRSSLRLLPI